MDWDSKKWRAVRDEHLYTWFLGDEDAVSCFTMISNIAEVWDDVEDGDIVSKGDISEAFLSATVNLQYNKFFQKHREAIMALQVMVLNAWLDANIMVNSGKEDRIKAYVLRNVGLELVPVFAFFKGGYQHMREVSLDSRAFFVHETFEQWEQER